MRLERFLMKSAGNLHLSTLELLIFYYLNFFNEVKQIEMLKLQLLSLVCDDPTG